MSLLQAAGLIVGGAARLRRIPAVPPLMRGRYARILSHTTDSEGRETCLVHLWTWEKMLTLTVSTAWLLPQSPDVDARLSYLKEHFGGLGHEDHWHTWHQTLHAFMNTMGKLGPVLRYHLDDVYRAVDADDVIRAFHKTPASIPPEVRNELVWRWAELVQAADEHVRPMEEALLNDA